jgi:hypothetical protein
MEQRLLDILIHFVEGVFTGPNGDYPAVLETLDGLTSDVALRKLDPESNSIWQIVDHINSSKIWEMEMIEKGKASSPEWIHPKGDEQAWKVEIDRLKETHAHLISKLREIDEKSLFRTKAEDNPSIGELILSITAHEAFHAGQIDFLKGVYNRTKE